MSMKKTLMGGAVILVLVAGLIYWSVSAGALGDTYEFVAYSKAGAEVTYGTLYVGFTKETKDRMNAWLDINADGTFSDEEKVVTNFPFQSRKDWNTGFGVKFTGALPEKPRVKIELDTGDNVEATLKLTTAENEDLLELHTVTNPENAMKGWGGETVHAKEPVTSTYRPGVPDLGQRIAECAPTACRMPWR